MTRISILTLVPVLMFVAVTEYVVMLILATLEIPDGPLAYLVDAALLAVLCSPLLYIWAPAMLPTPRDRVPLEPPVTPTATLDELERQALLKALEATQGDRSAAADILGIGRSTVYRKVKTLGLEGTEKT